MSAAGGMLGATEIVLQGSYGSMESRPTTLGSGNAAFALPVLLEQINTEVDINAINGAADEFLTSGPATPLDDLVEPAADQNVQINTAPKTTVGKQHGRKTKDVTPWQMAPRVLVVEDDNVSRLLLAKTLQLIGCKADVVSDGPAAVEMMGLNYYDLRLMDINLPSLSG